MSKPTMLVHFHPSVGLGPRPRPNAANKSAERKSTSRSPFGTRGPGAADERLGDFDEVEASSQRRTT